MAGESGWRTSLALAAVPALILTFGAIILPETPNSLCERGKVGGGHCLPVTGRNMQGLCCQVPFFTGARQAP